MAVAAQAIWSPAAAMEAVARERRAAVGFGVVALWALLSLISAAVSVLGGLNAAQLDPQDFPTVPPEALEGAAIATQIATPVFAVLGPFVWWVLVSLVMQLVTRFFGGSGPLSGMLAAVGVACLPFAIQSLIQIPLTGLQIVTGGQGAAAAVFGLLGFVLNLAFLAWHVALVIVGARFARGLGYGQSGGSCAISCAGCGGLVLLVAVVVGLIVGLAAGASGG